MDGNDSETTLQQISGLCASVFRDVDALIAWSHDADEEVRLRALETFFHLRTPESETCVRNALSDEDDLVRTTALEILAHWKDEKERGKILELFDDASDIVRMAAIVAVGDIGILEAKERLLQMTITCGDEERIRICYALVKLGMPEFFRNLCDGLNDDFYRVRCATANLLVELTDSRNKAVILRKLQEALSRETTVAAASTMKAAIKDIENAA